MYLTSNSYLDYIRNQYSIIKKTVRVKPGKEPEQMKVRSTHTAQHQGAKPQAATLEGGTGWAWTPGPGGGSISTRGGPPGLHPEADTRAPLG